jgi:hypothetical protein
MSRKRNDTMSALGTPVSNLVCGLRRELARDPSDRGHVSRLAIDRGFPVFLMASVADAFVNIFPASRITLGFAVSSDQESRVVLAAADKQGQRMERFLRHLRDDGEVRTRTKELGNLFWGAALRTSDANEFGAILTGVAIAT